MADETKISTDYVTTLANNDADIHASILMRKAHEEARPAKAICCRCGKRYPIGLMSEVGLDCYECRNCLFT
jgi:hypothetical protein